jgi:TubC N-terminal docking domain
MNTSELLTNLTQQGIQLWVERDKLKIHSPKGAIAPQLRADLTARKQEILKFLSIKDSSDNCDYISDGEGKLGLQTIGRLIGGFADSASQYKPPTIESSAMAQKLTVTLRPLPDGYQYEEVLKFREELKAKLENYGVNVLPWEQATREFEYNLTVPFLPWKKMLKTRIVKTGINAVIDVEREPASFEKLKIGVAETLYQLYSRLVVKDRKLAVSTIAKTIAWAQDNTAYRIEDPTNTQLISLTPLDRQLTDPQIPYQQKIKLGLNKLVKTSSAIAIGVSKSKISILNMNLSDSVFPKEELDDFILNSLIPKIFVPIAPIAMSRFEISTYDPYQSDYAANLVKLGKALDATGLFPSGSKIAEVIKRKSQRDIVNLLMEGRNGVSYGFLAYVEPPQYVGLPEITAREWDSLQPVPGFSSRDIRQNDIGRWYIKTKIGNKEVFKQIPDLWLVSSRSGSNKTNLNLGQDILRIGLKGGLMLQIPDGIDVKTVDIKPSYDVYAIMGLALSAALYAPKLIEKGAPLVHFHGYPSLKWFKSNEYFAGVCNPSVPCGTYESGIFNFLSIYQLANNYGNTINLACSIEPDHGSNIIAYDLEYLIERLKLGCEQGQIELGGRHFTSLK